MKRIIAFLCLVISLVSLASCGNKQSRTDVYCSGEYINEEYNDLEAISLSVDSIYVKNNNELIPVNIEIHAGLTPSIVLIAQKEVLDSITVDCTLGAITITGDSKSYYHTNSVTIKIYGYSFSSVRCGLADLNIGFGCLAEDASITAASASKVISQGFLGESLLVSLSDYSVAEIKSVNCNKLVVKESTNSQVTITTASVKEFSISLSEDSTINVPSVNAIGMSLDAIDASKLSMAGTCQKIDIVVSGNAVYDCKDLVLNSATVISSGSSKVFLTASNGINVVASGVSEITYYGTATVTQTSISGNSKIIRGED